MELAYSVIGNTLDINFTASSSPGYTLPPSINEFSDLNLILKSLIPDDMKVKSTINDFRLKSKLTTIKFYCEIFFLYGFRVYSVTFPSSEQSSTRIYSNNDRNI